jgi:hypothetical protein
MDYELNRLAPGSYDVLFHGIVVASLVRDGQKDRAVWTVELLEEWLPGDLPVPFTGPTHRFSSLEKARQWLGDAKIRDVGQVGV